MAICVDLDAIIRALALMRHLICLFDFCSTEALMKKSYRGLRARNFIEFAIILKC